MLCVVVKYSIVLEAYTVTLRGVAVNARQFQAEVVSNRMWHARDSFRWQPNHHDTY